MIIIDLSRYLPRELTLNLQDSTWYAPLIDFSVCFVEVKLVSPYRPVPFTERVTLRSPKTSRPASKLSLSNRSLNEGRDDCYGYCQVKLLDTSKYHCNKVLVIHVLENYKIHRCSCIIIYMLPIQCNWDVINKILVAIAVWKCHCNLIWFKHIFIALIYNINWNEA